MSLSARIQDLKHRGVFRVGVVYLGVGFALIQAADLIFPRLGLPDWTVTAVVIAALLGFPVALALAWAFDVKRADTGDNVAIDAASATPHTRLPALALGLLVLPVMAAGAWYITQRTNDDDVNADLVAVLPFRVAGAAGDLSYLREGMVDLLAAKLGGTEGVRAVDSRTVLAAWRKAVPTETADLTVEHAVKVGRSVGAGHLLLGEIVGNTQKVVVSASLVAVRNEATTRTSVEGPLDSLPRMVDKLAAQLLALNSGEDQQRMETLVGTSLPAVREYLHGRKLLRRGNYAEAIERFRAALQMDSTFALAAWGMARAGGWVDAAAQREANNIVMAHRDRLPPRDLIMFMATVGPNFPAPFTGREWIDGGARALQSAPDDPEAWYMFGDALYHYGGVTGEPDYYKRAREAFDRAMELDSSFAGPLEHAVELAAMQNDTAEVRRLATMYLATDSTGETADVVRWLAAATTNDMATLQRTWQRVDSMAPLTLAWLAGMSQERQIRMQDADRIADALERRPIFAASAYFDNAGQPSRADDAFRALRTEPNVVAVNLVRSVLFSGRDTAGAGAADALLASRTRAEAFADSSTRPAAYRELCALEEWRTLRGDFKTAPAALARLRATNPQTDGAAEVDFAHKCAVTIDAIVAVGTDRSDAAEAVKQLETLALAGQQMFVLRFEGNLILAQLLEKRGDNQGALAALRRRSRFGLTPALYLSTYLREEGRLAAKLGDLEGARRAYSHYLAMRPKPEPAVVAEVESVRRALAAIARDR